VLDALEAGDPAAFGVDPLAADHYALAIAAMEAGYDPQQILPDGETAVVIATSDSTDLLELTFVRQETGWIPAE